MIRNPEFDDLMSDGEDNSKRPNDATGRNFRNIIIWSMAIVIVSVGLLFFIVSRKSRGLQPEHPVNNELPAGGSADSSHRQGIPPDSL